MKLISASGQFKGTWKKNSCRHADKFFDYYWKCITNEEQIYPYPINNVRELNWKFTK